MKKFLMIAITVCLGTQLQAQQMQASAGLELGIPFKNYMTIMGGVSGGFEYVVWEQIAATGQLGFQVIGTNNKAYNDAVHSGTIPMVFFQVGGKYYIQEVQNGFYGHAQFGFHNGYHQYTYGEGTVYQTDYSSSFGGLSWAFGGGYQTEKFDLSARFNGISVGSRSYYSGYSGSTGVIYFGIRAAYLIPIGN